MSCIASDGGGCDSRWCAAANTCIADRRETDDRFPDTDNADAPPLREVGRHEGVPVIYDVLAVLVAALFFTAGLRAVRRVEGQ